jgi:Domain of unknown function (DUF4328)
MNAYTYKPPSQLAKALQVLLAVTGGLSLVVDTWISSVLRTGTFVLHTPESRAAQFEPSYWTGTALPNVAWIPAVVSWAVIVVWLIWQHQATANLWARGYAGLKTRPGWAVGWWFIPFANLAMPLVSMLEVDRRSTPDGVPRRGGAVLGWWWAAWIASSIVPAVGAFGAVIGAFSDMVQELDRRGAQVTSFDFSAAAHGLAPWLLVAGVLQAVAAALAISVVRRIDEGQRGFGDPPVSMIPLPARPDALP